MVTGIDSFKEWFKGSEEQYAIINESIGFPIVQPLGKLYLNLNFRKK